MNKTIDVNIKDPKTGINAFWIASIFGHGHIMRELAMTGIDVLCDNPHGMNALHIACANNYLEVVKMLVNSDYPLNI